MRKHFIGVVWDEYTTKYKTKFKGKVIGWSITEEEAAEIYDKRAMKVGGPSARTNFKYNERGERIYDNN